MNVSDRMLIYCLMDSCHILKMRCSCCVDFEGKDPVLQMLEKTMAFGTDTLINLISLMTVPAEGNR
jgi:hypothetical protein